MTLTGVYHGFSCCHWQILGAAPVRMSSLEGPVDSPWQFLDMKVQSPLPLRFYSQEIWALFVAARPPLALRWGNCKLSQVQPTQVDSFDHKKFICSCPDIYPVFWSPCIHPVGRRNKDSTLNGMGCPDTHHMTLDGWDWRLFISHLFTREKGTTCHAGLHVVVLGSRRNQKGFLFIHKE